MTAISPRECFNLIAGAVQPQIDRLLIPEGSSERSKGQKIFAALDRLYLATIQKYPEGVKVPRRYTFLTYINNHEVTNLDLDTLDTMLDVRISEWENATEPWSQGDMDFPGRSAGYRRRISLRTALNIARYNFFNSSDGTWGPLWGKSRALKQVERELTLSTIRLHPIN